MKTLMTLTMVLITLNILAMDKLPVESKAVYGKANHTQGAPATVCGGRNPANQDYTETKSSASSRNGDAVLNEDN